MTQSMTAFARKEASFPWGTLSWEIRSVNHRYLEPNLKLPESLREIEMPVRDRLRSRLNRGKIECTLRFQSDSEEQSINLNQHRVQQLLDVIDTLQSRSDAIAKVDPLQLLQYPGVMIGQTVDTEQVVAAALEMLDSALESLIETRVREGAELDRLIVQRLDAIGEIVAQVKAELPGILAAQREQLQTKVSQLAVELDPERLEQEIVLLAQRADVAEELDRLETHVAEVRRVLKQKGPVGRRLDFLMQELNREANTLASKSIVTSTTQSAVELKVLIEQMREQIQNIE